VQRHVEIKVRAGNSTLQIESPRCTQLLLPSALVGRQRIEQHLVDWHASRRDGQIGA
jgi:hypothetical protein